MEDGTMEDGSTFDRTLAASALLALCAESPVRPGGARLLLAARPNLPPDECARVRFGASVRESLAKLCGVRVERLRVPFVLPALPDAFAAVLAPEEEEADSGEGAGGAVHGPTLGVAIDVLPSAEASTGGERTVSALALQLQALLLPDGGQALASAASAAAVRALPALAALRWRGVLLVVADGTAVAFSLSALAEGLRLSTAAPPLNPRNPRNDNPAEEADAHAVADDYDNSEEESESEDEEDDGEGEDEGGEGEVDELTAELTARLLAHSHAAEAHACSPAAAAASSALRGEGGVQTVQSRGAAAVADRPLRLKGARGVRPLWRPPSFRGAHPMLYVPASTNNSSHPLLPRPSLPPPPPPRASTGTSSAGQANGGRTLLSTPRSPLPLHAHFHSPAQIPRANESEQSEWEDAPPFLTHSGAPLWLVQAMQRVSVHGELRLDGAAVGWAPGEVPTQLLSFALSARPSQPKRPRTAARAALPAGWAEAVWGKEGEGGRLGTAG
ncbi:hypothetical protein T492DRAFT_902726, partial [Pavlovales sp. CCMP2436]